MKANRKFLNNDDEAVSPVIAVILMVAITVVLAATVYVWVSGFSGGGQASASMSISQVAAYSDALAGTAATDGLKFTVTSVSSGFLLSSLKILNPTQSGAYTLGVTASGCTAAATGEFVLLDDGATCKDADDTTQQLGAGDVIKIYFVSGDMEAGDTIQFVDTNSNNVISSIVLR